jgi:hypothetical protein
MGRSPDASPSAGVANSGTGGHTGLLGDPKAQKVKADTHLRDSTHKQGAVGRSEMHRNGSTMAMLTCTGGEGVPMSYGFTGGGRHRGEHQRLTTHLPEGVVLP